MVEETTVVSSYFLLSSMGEETMQGRVCLAGKQEEKGARPGDRSMNKCTRNEREKEREEKKEKRRPQLCKGRSSPCISLQGTQTLHPSIYMPHWLAGLGKGTRPVYSHKVQILSQTRAANLVQDNREFSRVKV